MAATVVFNILDQASDTIKNIEKNVVKSTKNMTKAEAEYAKKIASTQTKVFDLKREMASASKQRQKEIREEIKALGSLQQANRQAYSQERRSSGKSEGGGMMSGIGGELIGLAGNPYALAGAALAGIYTVTEKVIASQDIWRQRVQGTEQDYQKLGEQTLKISNVFGKNNDEIVRAGNAFAKSFGVDAKDGMDLIYEGFKKGADMNGLFLDNITEYSIQAKEAGMSTEEFVAFLIRAEKEGIYSDKGIDSIKESGLRLRQNTKAVKEALKPLKDEVELQIKSLAASGKSYEALKLVTAELEKGYLSAEQMQTIVADILGGAGEDAAGGLVKVLKDSNIELKDMETNLSDNQIATIALKEEWSSFESSVGNVFDDAIIGIKSGILDLVGFLKTVKENPVFDLYYKVATGVIIAPFKLGQTIGGKLKESNDIYNNAVQKGKDDILAQDIMSGKKEFNLPNFANGDDNWINTLQDVAKTFDMFPNELDKGDLVTELKKEKSNNTKDTKNTKDGSTELLDKTTNKTITDRTTKLSESKIVRSVTINIEQVNGQYIEKNYKDPNTKKLASDIALVIAKTTGDADSFASNQ